MSSTLGLYTTNTARLVDTPLLRMAHGRRVITVQPHNKSRLVFLTDPAGLAVEQYKLLRRRLCTLRPQGGTMLITSPSPGDGKTLTSINLAWCMAEGGQDTCLVDLDFRAPGVAPTLGYSFDEDGVDDVLAGRRTISQAIRQLRDRPLHVLGVRKRQVSPGDMLAPVFMVPFLTDLKAMFKWVILDFAPIIPMADVAEVLPYVDGTLMVIRSGKTDRSMVEPSLEILGPKLWGVVVNDSVISGSSYYGYYGNDHRK